MRTKKGSDTNDLRDLAAHDRFFVLLHACDDRLENFRFLMHGRTGDCLWKKEKNGHQHQRWARIHSAMSG